MMEDTFTSSRIIMIEPHDSKQCWKKVSEILAVVDRDLGLADMQISDYESKKVNIRTFHKILNFNTCTEKNFREQTYIYIYLLGFLIYTREKCSRGVSSRTH